MKTQTDLSDAGDLELAAFSLMLAWCGMGTSVMMRWDAAGNPDADMSLFGI